jgi:hypothetical protein
MDFRCAISQGILTGIIFFLLMLLVGSGMMIGKPSYEQDNIRMIWVAVSALVAFLVNGFLFGGCGTTTGW